MRKFLATAVAISTLLVAMPTYAAVCFITAVPNAGNQSFAMRNDGMNTVFTGTGSQFTPSSNCTVSAIGMNKSSDSSRSDVHVVIFDDSAGSPNNVLETGSDFSSSATRATATSTFSSTTLVSGTPYWIILKDTTNNGNAVYAFYTDQAGTSKRRDDGVWSAGGFPTQNVYFEIDGTAGGGASAPPKPSTGLILFGDW